MYIHTFLQHDLQEFCFSILCTNNISKGDVKVLLSTSDQSLLKIMMQHIKS